MPQSYRALAAADLPTLTPPPALIMTPISGMMTAEQAPPETLIYRVPEDTQAIIKLIVCTSSADEEEDVTLRCYSPDLGPVPLFGPIHLGQGEWAEWSGSLTIGALGEIRGAINTTGSVSVAVYGMERTTS